MDFRRLTQALSTTNRSSGNNNTESLTLTELPSNILEALVPGYGLISRYVASTFGLDISIFVSIGIILIAATKAAQFLYEKIEDAFHRLFVSKVYIDEDDDLFDMVMDWLAATQGPTSRRRVRAKTQRGTGIEAELEVVASDVLDENGLFDYNKWSARTPPRFEPHYGSYRLWHQGTLFFFRRSRREAAGQRVQVHLGGGMVDDDVLELECLGGSTEPIKELLRHIKSWSLDKLCHSTTIRHPTPKDRARYGGSWSRTFSRPSRPMETVILDDEQKIGIIKDMNEFLHPSSPKWYAARGIPYRRGYLFHGPPGTGKSSLSFALAGVFRLDIYAINLQEATLTEGDLMQLLNSLSRRCIVLLEDIDAAGLLRDAQSDNDDKSKPKSSKKAQESKEEGEKDGQKEAKAEADFTLKDLARELKALGGSKRREEKTEKPSRAPGTGISLSGLLNAIDGVATQEGRVLIMTTNYPEKLDAALVRPGRVDRKVEFRLALQEQIRELFMRMYSVRDQIPDLQANVRKALTNGDGGYVQRNGHANGNVNKHNGNSEERKKGLDEMSQEELESLAVEFAERVPDNTFTPAEIQNHLMLYKKEPRTAVDRADAWVQEILADKEKQKLKLESEDSEDLEA